MVGTGELALVNDYLLALRGDDVRSPSRRVSRSAPIYTLLCDPTGTEGRFAGHPVTASALQRTGLTQGGFGELLPLFPMAVERLPLRDPSVIVSSSSAFAHGVRPPDGACMFATATRVPLRLVRAPAHATEVPPAMRPRSAACWRRSADGIKTPRGA